MIPVSRPLITDTDKQAVIDTIESGWISSSGSKVSEFEKAWAKKCCRDYGIACSSGTSGLEACISSFCFQTGKNIIIPNGTIVSCSNAIYRAGLHPNYVDNCAERWTMDENMIEQAINPDTVAIMSVDLYGTPSNYNKIDELCKKYNLKHIIDAAESHGAKYDNRIAHSYGDAVVFSFFPNKQITTGEGGMIVTNDKHLASEVRSYINLYFDKDRSYNHLKVGANFRMTNMQAALGLSQIFRIEEIVAKKRHNYEIYKNLIRDRGLDIDFQEVDSNVLSTYWVVAIKSHRFNGRVNSVRCKLFDLGIETRRLFKPLSRQPFNVGKEYFCDGGKNCESLYDSGFYLPSSIDLSSEEIIYVVDQLTEAMRCD